MGLYHVNIALQELIFEAEHTEDKELYEALQDRINELSLEGEELLASLIGHYKNKCLEVKTYDAEIERLKKEKSRLESHAERSKALIEKYVGTGRTFHHGTHKVGWRLSESVKILQGTELPPEYIRTKITTEPDLISIKKAIKEGNSIAGCCVEIKNNIQIK